ncbi:MAG: class I SAM-dependent methyltransferase [Pseudomonadota bacterium]
MRLPAGRIGILDALERRRSNRAALWLRSLFSIHDIEDMVHLDLPWWCFGAIEEVDRFLASLQGRARVLEWGSGASTLWLAKRAAHVTSIEHDAPWAAIVATLTSDLDRVALISEPPEPKSEGRDDWYGSAKAGWRDYSFRRYVNRAEEIPGPFDLIVIDGRCRERCLDMAKQRLAPGGRILFDNTGRRRYREAIARSGLVPTTFAGLAPGLPYPDHTTILEAPA